MIEEEVWNAAEVVKNPAMKAAAMAAVSKIWKQNNMN